MYKSLSELNKKLLKVIVWLVIVLVYILANQVAAKAQTAPAGDRWSEPEIIFESSNTIFNPTIVGNNNVLHVFWRLILSEEGRFSQQIYQTETNSVSGWTFPVDVIADGFINAPAALIDQTGIIHLTWQGRGQKLQYSRSLVSKGINGHSWTEPMVMDEVSGHSQLVVDSRNYIHLVYARPNSSGVFHRYSSNGGRTWSLPQNISSTAGINSVANFPRLAVGENNELHVVWTEFSLPEAWPPSGLYYARSGNNGQDWTGFTQIAGEGYNQINLAVVGTAVHVVWNGMAGVHGRYHRWSKDNGRTWTETERLDTLGVLGSSGVPPMAIDSANTLHLLVVDGDCLLYLAWHQDEWEPAACISQQAAGATDYIEEPDLTVVQGNKLHVVFWDDRKRLWHMMQETTASSQSDNSFDTPQLTSTAEPLIATLPATTDYDFSDFSNSEIAGTADIASPSLPILVGVLLTAIVVSVVIAFMMIFNKRH